MTRGTGGANPITPPRVHHAWSRAVCHPADRVVDTEIGGVRKRKGRTGGVNPTTSYCGWSSAAQYVPLCARHT